ncbi:NHL domain-containing protein [Rugosimonospora acidiphila]|uniref:NHL domain-containing protein n=1 Tax=Rugosimonospora acidiphila TaxID=556531 RepID=UPI0031EC99ED
MEFVGGGAASAAAPPQSYDLTGAPYCDAATGLATIALNSNLISNPGAEYATERGAVPGGAGTAAGSTVTDPDGVLLPDCWALTSTIPGSDLTNEIASAVAASYPGSSGTGTKNFYGGRSANDKAVAGTVTTASQTISLAGLAAAGATGPAGLPFALVGTLGGYANQDDNTILTAAWENANGDPVTDSAGHPVVTTLGPVLSEDRGETSMELWRRAYGTVPAGSTQVVITLTFTMGGAGNNDASADNLSLVIGDQAVPAGQTWDTTATCPTPATIALGSNLISNPGAEDYTDHEVTGAPSGGGVTAGHQIVPDCWVSQSDLPAPDPVLESGNATYAGKDGSRLFWGGTTPSTAPNPAPPGFTTQVQGITTTATQSIDVSSLNAGGQPYKLAGLLGGYSTQNDFAMLTATFQGADGNPLGTDRLGPVTAAERANVTGLFPTWRYGTVPAGTTKVLITLELTAISTGADNNGIADDLSLTFGPDAKPAPQSYDATSSTVCPAADQVTPALDSNLLANPGAEDFVAANTLGAPVDDAVTVPDCWISSSALAVPDAVAESYAQTSATYPGAVGARVFWGGTNPDGGIAGVSTMASQPIDLSGIAAGGQPFKLSGMLGGYATQDDNAVVSATFLDASGKTLSYAAIGPVKAAARGNVSSLVRQTWYGTVPAGAAKAVVTVTMTAVSTGNDLNGEADDLSLVIGPSSASQGSILQTLPYDAGAGGGGGTHVDPGSGAIVPNLVPGALYRPAGVSAAGGVVYASNTGDNVISKLQNGATTQVVGSLENYGEQGDGGKATNSTLYQPNGTVVDAKGDMFIADSSDNVVREVTPNGTIQRFAGTGTAGLGVAGLYPFSLLSPTRTALNHPEAVAVNAQGDVYIADTYNNRVLRVTSRGQVFDVAGIGRAGYSGDRGLGVLASLNMPTGLALDAKGNLYIADSGNNLIRRVDAKTGIITTVAGNVTKDKANDGLGGFSGDGGSATSAQLNDPQGVAVDGAGDLFIADTFNHAIREVTPKGTISTVVNHAGTNGAAPLPGGESSGQTPSASGLNTPSAIAVDPSTNVLYIADTKNGAIAEVLGLAQSGTAAGPTAPSGH